jgi:hypothetical protein
MEPRQFPQANKVLKPPAGMTSEQCGDLHVFSDGHECISLWQLSWKERISALLFGKVWLFVHMGDTQPPVAMMATKEIFKEVAK